MRGFGLGFVGGLEIDMMDWQPIETAPRDGTRLLLLLGNGEVFSGWAQHSGGFYRNQRFHTDGSDIGFINPTHWMQLPAPPIVEVKSTDAP